MGILKRLTVKRLKELLNYNPETGSFTWIGRSSKYSNKIKIGEDAEYQRPDGYGRITIDCKQYYSHRLAWFYQTGSWPIFDIDHINGDRSDNRWINLRNATRSQNLINGLGRKIEKFKGVRLEKRIKKYVAYTARITINGKEKHLGTFGNEVDAAICYNYNAAYLHGEFAVLNKIPEDGYIHD